MEEEKKTTNEIKEDLKRYYNNAIRYYNAGDFNQSLIQMRYTIEGLCTLIIYDMEGENVAPELISGKKYFDRCDYKNFTFTITIKDQNDNIKITGSKLVDLAKKAIYHKKEVVLRSDGNLKKNIDAAISTLFAEHSNCSSDHHFGGSNDNPKQTADKIVKYLIDFFSRLHKILSKDSSEFLDSLDKPNDSVYFQDPPSALVLEMSNDFVVLDDMTHHFSQNTDFRYVAILPEKSTDSFGNPLSPGILANFFRIHWNFVVDLNPKTPEGIYGLIPSTIEPSLRTITGSSSEITGSSILTNWYFAKGREDLKVLDNKEMMRKTPNEFKTIFSKIIQTGKTDNYYIFDFSKGYADFNTLLFNKLEDIFGNWDAVNERCTIISFAKGDDKNPIEQWADRLGVDNTTILNLSFEEFLKHIEKVKPHKSDCSSNKLFIRKNTIDLSKDLERYKAAGIELFGSTGQEDDKERRLDFYRGAEITWDGLDNQDDVLRNRYRTVKQRVSEIIRTMRRTQEFSLLHRPGSGATTLSRRLAYDIRKEDEEGVIICTVVEIKSCSNICMTGNYLCQLSEKIDNSSILAIVESKRVGRTKYNDLVKRMADAGKKILFFYIEPYTGRFIPKENVKLLESVLEKDEFERFKDKYIELERNKETLLKVESTNNLEVIDFPLMAMDNETSDNLSSYVNEWMQVLPENLKKFCAYVGFVFKYSDFGVNQRILKSIWADADHSTISSYDKQTIEAIEKLIIEERSKEGKLTGIWRPRYNRFSEFLLSSYKRNWKDGLSEIAKDFISLCKNVGEMGSDDKDMLYSIFVIRKNADYRALEDKSNLKNKFSILIKDLGDLERAESLLSTLKDTFPNDPIVLGHYARFLYEKTTMLEEIDINDRLFSESQEALNCALNLNSNNAELYHMQGMLIRRKISALSKSYTNDNSDKKDKQDIEDCLEVLVQSAYDAFEKSIQLSPTNPYGYASESQLFKESIELGQKLLEYNDYAFCETNEIYADYAEKLGNVLDSLEKICYAFKDDCLSQISGSYELYKRLRLFHQTIVGMDEGSIQRYKDKYDRSTGERKVFFGDLYVKSILYSKPSSTDSRRAFANLSSKERREIERVLEYRRNQGDIKSYDYLFMLKLYGSDEFPIDKAIDLLKEWENQFVLENQLGWGYLNACFYLAVCYSAKCIIGNIPNKELATLSATYFKKSDTLAKQLGISTVKSRCYLGEKEDIHCIVNKEEEARTVKGIIINIRSDNKGILRMPCGIDASFNAKGYDIIRDEGQPLQGVLGFPFAGPGLYEFRRDSDIQMQMAYQEEKESTFEELCESYVPEEDLVEEDKQEDSVENEKPTMEKNNGQGVEQIIGPKIIGKMELPDSKGRKETNRLYDNRSKHYSLGTEYIEGKEYEGTIKIESIESYENDDKRIYDVRIKYDGFPHPIQIRGKNKDKFRDGDKVTFVLNSEPNKKTGGLFRFATDVRPDE